MATINDLPPNTSATYAYRQQIYEQELAAGRSTGAGALEPFASAAGSVQANEPVQEQLTALFGLDHGSTLALFPALNVETSTRRRSPYGAPALGGIEQREAMKAKLADYEASHPESARAVSSLVAMLDKTIEDDQMRIQVRSMQGSLIAA